MTEAKKIGDKISIQEFIELVGGGFFVDYDGHGYGIDKRGAVRDDIIIKPSQIDKIPEDIVAVLWANR
jgi:hypothetical protein